MRTVFYVLIFALAGCASGKKGISEQVVTIVHGKTFGRCVGYCIWEQVYTDGEMTSAKRSHRPDQYPEVKITRNFTTADMKRLLEDFDLTKFKSLPETIGCPDCADGGAEYVEITTDKETRRVTFENGKAPYGFENFMVTLNQENDKHKKDLE